MAYTWPVFLLTFSLSLTLAYSSYLVTTPSKLVVGRPHTVWVYLHRIQEPTTVTATLRLPKEKVELVTLTRTSTSPGAFELQFPATEELQGEEWVLLGLNASGGVTFYFVEMLPVLSAGCMPLIQTDKAVYKPGQTVHIRVLAMDGDRQILIQPLNVSVQDSSGNLIMDWKNVENSSGVITKQLELSDLPPLGEWKVSAQCSGGSASKPFSVEKYVLPRFEVTLETVPQYLVRTTYRSFKVIIKARYTYGKRVPGTATVTVTAYPFGRNKQTVQAADDRAGDRGGV